MKRSLKTTSYALTILLIILSAVSVCADIIWSDTTSSPVTRGVTLKKDVVFTDNGWQVCHVVTVDLTDPAISLTSLFDSRGTSYLKNVKAMAAEEKNVVAAINADFFSWAEEAGRGSSLGPIYKNGEIISSPSTDNLPAIFFDKDGKAFVSPLNMKLFIVAPNGNRAQVLHINKFHSMQSVIMYTPDWGATTPGSYNGIIELVAVDGKVTEIRQNMEPTKIPENGYVLATSYDISHFFTENFVVGDNIDIDIQFSPEIKNIETAVGGGATLVKNGEIADFEMNITGSNPRSAIGIDKDGKHLFLVAVDGRITATPGFTQTELANYMLSIGAYNALNFDGGGSTTLVTKDPKTNTLGVANELYSGAMRSVSNAFAIKANESGGVPSHLDVTTSSENVFIGEGVELWSFAYDQFYNPSYIDNPVYQYKADDGGKFIGNIYYPKTPGIRTIDVSVGGLTAQVKVRALAHVSGISLYPDKLNLKSGETINISIIGKDRDGFTAPISPDKAIWSCNNGCATVKNGTVSRISSGDFSVSASYGDMTAYISTGSYGNINERYDFEKEASFYGYPSYVKGSYSLVSENVKSGDYAGKLSYDFNSEGEDTQAAHVSFGKAIPVGNAKTVGIWVHANENNMHQLRAQFDTPGGSALRATFAARVDWNGYKHLEIDIPEEARGGYLSKIYLVQNSPDEKNSGEIYLDEITLKGIENYDENPSVFLDDFSKGNFAEREHVCFIPDKLESNTMLNNLINHELEKATRSGNGYVLAKTGFGNFAGINGFTSFKKENTLFITLDGFGGGIRASNPIQWHSLMETLETVSEKNVVVILNCGLEKAFNDKKEYELLCTVLRENLYEKGKNVFLVSSGTESCATADNGIRYITVKTPPAITTENFFSDVKENCYVKFSLAGDNLKYTFIPIAPWN